ncbi:helix-turn-helix domain-containing protein [Salegentibacter sp. 24]|jgi:transcriptional regulator with XRE-family HTH domain|uniref:helix-turn-helix domain-containing protein n=1 Tax=Salegentibacter sp. 24 TaxID=2183986 RepID=UPI0010617F4E|nr:helix-turn-helix domain-containing protein [Salegentibacter sp. 24]
MKNNFLAEKLKTLRKRSGLTQEELAENSKLSLRTIQRLEGNETEPTGDTLRKLATALKVNQDELTDWEIIDDSSFLKTLNISALIFLLFPILGIILPAIMWFSKKNKIRNLNRVSKAIINFEITWNIILFAGIIFGLFIVQYKIQTTGVISMSHYQTRNQFFLYFIPLMYFLNILIILLNSFRIQKDLHVFYPKINFIGK